MMANLDVVTDVQDGDASLTGTQTATITTDNFNPGKAGSVAMQVKISAPVSLTSVDITVEISHDGGTDFTELTTEGSATQAALKQMTAADDAYEWWLTKIPDDPNIFLRSVWTLVGTSYDVDEAKWIVTRN